MLQKRLAWNTISSLTYQITTIICGLILPRLILQHFGSEVNGLINSITQFLQIIAFLELGVGAVVQSSLYRPLVEKDNKQISKIISSGEQFFRTLAKILLVYVVSLMGVYPIIAHQNFGHLYTATLIAVISISSFAQYYFGMLDRLLLTADQRGFIQYTSQTITLIVNTLACVIIIKVGFSIHIVKLTTSLIYLLRPLVIRGYVNRHYSINRKILYKGEPINQKWNGVAQHVAAVILDSTDSIVLTIFATLTDVSIYSVYSFVVVGIKQLFTSMMSGVQSLLGELWVKQEREKLLKYMEWIEWSVHTLAVFIWGCSAILIIPFVRVYTYGITDANYIVPFFAILIILANAFHSLRTPYNMMILAVGHYKQTQHNYVIAAIINILISILTVRLWGLVGVAIGTLIAMGYQTIWMAIYCYKHLTKSSMGNFVKQICVDVIIFVLITVATSMFSMESNTYPAWIVLSLKVVFMSLFIVVIFNFLFYKDKIVTLMEKLKVRLFT